MTMWVGCPWLRKRLTSGMPIGSLIGGLHLPAAMKSRMIRTLGALRRLAPQEIAACHCNGYMAARRLAEAFPRQTTEAHAGRTFEIVQ